MYMSLTRGLRGAGLIVSWSHPLHFPRSNQCLKVDRESWDSVCSIRESGDTLSGKAGTYDVASGKVGTQYVASGKVEIHYQGTMDIVSWKVMTQQIEPTLVN